MAGDGADIDPLEASGSCLEASAGSADVAAVEIPTMTTAKPVGKEAGPGSSMSALVEFAAKDDRPGNDAGDVANMHFSAHFLPMAASPSPSTAWPAAAHQVRAAAVPLMPAAVALHSAPSAAYAAASWVPAHRPSADVPASCGNPITALPGDASARDSALVTCKRELRTLRRGMRQLRAESAIMMSRTAEEITRLTSGTRAALKCTLDRQRHGELLR